LSSKRRNKAIAPYRPVARPWEQHRV